MVFVEEFAEQVASMHRSWLAVADDIQVGGWIKVLITPVRAPRANAYAERLADP